MNLAKMSRMDWKGGTGGRNSNKQVVKGSTQSKDGQARAWGLEMEEEYLPYVFLSLSWLQYQ